jgi:hypothetical protein
MSEYSLAEDEWVHLIPPLLDALNNWPLESRDGYSPNKLHFGRDNAPTGKNLLERMETQFIVVPKRKTRKENMQRLVNALEGLTKELDTWANRTYDYVSYLRDQKRLSANKTREPYFLQFQQGDWVLISRYNTPRERDKIKLVWNGPFQIIEILSTNVYW